MSGWSFRFFACFPLSMLKTIVVVVFFWLYCVLFWGNGDKLFIYFGKSACTYVPALVHWETLPKFFGNSDVRLRSYSDGFAYSSLYAASTTCTGVIASGPLSNALLAGAVCYSFGLSSCPQVPPSACTCCSFSFLTFPLNIHFCL